MTYFDKLNRPRVQAVLNLLGEAPFFYRHDDAEAFAFLRRNRAEFERFYRELYGWELLVDAATARVYKDRWYNRELKPSQRDAFDPARRLDCVGFLLLLEFYERLLEASNRGPTDLPPPRFAFGELFAHARDRLAHTRRPANARYFSTPSDHILPRSRSSTLVPLGPAKL